MKLRMRRLEAAGTQSHGLTWTMLRYHNVRVPMHDAVTTIPQFQHLPLKILREVCF